MQVGLIHGKEKQYQGFLRVSLKTACNDTVPPIFQTLANGRSNNDEALKCRGYK